MIGALVVLAVFAAGVAVFRRLVLAPPITAVDEVCTAVDQDADDIARVEVPQQWYPRIA